ncbi:MAG: hypothetical protein IJ863_00120 [Spirochaetales bacterium]|nr:hypothetical protein [Spirochaetales bacterium]
MGSSTSKGNISTALLVLTLLSIAALVVGLALLMVSDGVRAGRYVNPDVASQVVRGTIYDRNGRALAMEVPENNIYVSSSDYNDVVAQILAVHLGSTPGEILSLISKDSSSTLVRRAVKADAIDAINADLERNGVPADVLAVRKEYTRTYPAAFHAAQLIQETESVYNKVLSPNPAYGQSTTYGNDVYLTIDLDIQYLLDLTVQQVYEMQRPEYSVAFILDIQSGDLLASTTYPFYNLNDASGISDSMKVNKTLVSSISRPDVRVSSINPISKVVQHDTDAIVTDLKLNGDFTVDFGKVKDMVDNPDGNSSVLAKLSDDNPKYLVFIASVNPKFYQISSVLEFAITSLEQGLQAQTKL